MNAFKCIGELRPQSNKLAPNLRRYHLCRRKYVSTHLSGLILLKIWKESSAGTTDDLVKAEYKPAGQREAS